MSDPFFLLQDSDGRVGLFTFDARHGQGVQVPEAATLRDFQRMGPASSRSLARLACCLHAARVALEEGRVAAPAGDRPEVLVVVDPPRALLERDDVVQLRSERPAVLLGWGTAEQAWELADRGGGWIDVFRAWDDDRHPSGLARYGACHPYGSPPVGMMPERTYARLDAPAGPPFTTGDLPAGLRGAVPRLGVRFQDFEHIDLGDYLPCWTPDPAPPRGGRPRGVPRGELRLVLALLAFVFLFAAFLRWFLPRLG